MATPHAVHHHAPPSGFLRKHVFSLDHKVIGKQYYDLRSVGRRYRDDSILANAAAPGLDEFCHTRAALPLQERRARKHYDSGILPATDDHAWNHHGVLRPDHRSLRRVWQLLSAHPGGCGGYAFPPLQHDVVLGHLCRLPGFDFGFFVFSDGPTLAGWTQYAPLSAVGAVAGPGQGLGEVLWASSIGLFCIGQLLGSLNFITTTLDLRTKGMSLMRLPYTAWAWFITSCMGLGAFAVLMPACIFLILDHVAGTSFFVPSNLVINDQLQPHAGGSTLLWQHLFWFFGHPEVYIAIIPAMGITSHILRQQYSPAIAQSQGHRLLHGDIGASQLYGVRPSHVCQRDEPGLFDCIFVPDTDYYDSCDHHRADLDGQFVRIARCALIRACLFSLGMISMFISGGVSGFFLAQPSLDIMLHATYFVVGHFHLVMAVAAIFGIFAGTYFWFPKMFGRMMNETLGKIHFWLSFVGAYCIFMPFHYLGIARERAPLPGICGRLLAAVDPGPSFHYGRGLCTGAAQLIFLYNFFHSRFWGKPAPANPWECTSLEWSTPSPPPPFDNFGPTCPSFITTPISMELKGRPAII